MPWLFVRFWYTPADRTQRPELLSLPLGPDARTTIEDCIAYYQSQTRYHAGGICCANPACRRSIAGEADAVDNYDARFTAPYVGRLDEATGDLHVVCYYALCCRGTDCMDTIAGPLRAQLLADEEAAIA